MKLIIKKTKFNLIVILLFPILLSAQSIKNIEEDLLKSLKRIDNFAVPVH